MKFVATIFVLSLPALGYACPNLSGNFFNPKYQYQIQQSDCQSVKLRRIVPVVGASEITAEIGKLNSYPWHASPEIVRVDETWAWQSEKLELTQAMVSAAGKTTLKFVTDFWLESDGSLSETLQSYSLENGVYLLNGTMTAKFNKAP